MPSSERLDLHNFLSRFVLFRGMQTMHHRYKNEDPDILIAKICCDPKWPICFLDITQSWVLHDFFTFKSKYTIVQDYFTENS